MSSAFRTSKRPCLYPAAALFLCLLAGAGVATVRAASLLEPTAENAAAAAALLQNAAALPADWRPQVAPGSTAPAAADARREWLLLRGWQKIVVDEAGAARPTAEQELPDLWSRSRDYQRAWYATRVDLGPTLPSTVWIRFDAVASQCEVFVNGRDMGGHLGGFTPFALELTSAAHPGVNDIVLYVRDEHAVHFPEQQKAVSQLGVTHPGTFNSVAGIRGGISLEARAAVHVDRILVQPSTRRNELRVTTQLHGAAADEVEIQHTIHVWPEGGATVLELPVTRTRTGTPSTLVVPWANARRWSPEHPNLYVLRTTVRHGRATETVETRFGFREFWADGKDFILNGEPIRLLGTSVARDLIGIETPEVGRRYARAALEYLKREFNYRAMRLHASIFPPAAADAADEVGVLLINQSGVWSAMGGLYQRGGDEFMHNLEREFAEWFWRDANKPSVVIWDVENEMIRDVRTPERERWVLGLDRFIKQLDSTRIVEHSGAAWYSPTQETIHLHMQEQFAEPLRQWQSAGKVPLVLGEFWVGGRGGETRLPNSAEFAGRADWLQEEARTYREKILEMRNYGASGVMPFWLDRLALGRRTNGLRRTFDPAANQLFYWPYPEFRNIGAAALAPVIAFAWPRGSSVAAGAALEKEIVVCNDREATATLAVSASFGGIRRDWTLTLPPAGQARQKVSFPHAASGTLHVTVADAAHGITFTDDVAVHAIAAEPLQPMALRRRVYCVPAPNATAAAALRAAGLSFETATALPVANSASTLVIVPPGAPRDALGRNGASVRAYVAGGGRLLVLNQTEEPMWLPLALPFWSALKKSEPEFTRLGWPAATRHLLFSREVVTYAGTHPAFEGLRDADLREWASADGRVADDAFVRPSALERRAGGSYRVLAGATRRENASLLECAIGNGTAVFCQLHLLATPAVPAARAVLLNLLRYLDGAAWRTAETSVGLVGNISAQRVATATGLTLTAFVPVTSGSTAPRIVLAGEGAAPALLDALTRGGSTVLVLSQKMAAKLPGYIAAASNRVIAGTRAGVAEDPLFWGISSGSFAPAEQSPVTGVLTAFPASARVVLNSISAPPSARARRAATPGSSVDVIETMDADKPIAVVESRGSGQLVVTTIEPWNAGAETHRQLLTTLLANAGVAIPVQTADNDIVLVKSTVPLQLDGKLDDWTNDMEDRNVSLFQHAAPIVVSGRQAGPMALRDNELSAIVYLLHDAPQLYVGGIVFGKDATQIELELGGRIVVLALGGNTVTLDGAALSGARVSVGRQPARAITDTRLLTLTAFNAQIGSQSAAIDLSGRTFEAALPKETLKLPSAGEMTARVRLRSASGATVVVPAEDGATLRLRFAR